MAKAICIIMALVSAGWMGLACADDQQSFGFGDNPSLSSQGISTQAGVSSAMGTLHSFDNINVQAPSAGVQISGVRVPQVFSATPLVGAQSIYSPVMIPAAYDPNAESFQVQGSIPSDVQYTGTLPQAGQYPVTQYPGAQTPITAMPAAQLPAAPLPETQYPAAPLPETQYPVSQLPVAPYPAAQFPDTQYPAAQLPAAQYPETQYPAAQVPEAPGYPGMADNQTDLYYPEQERGGQEQ